MCAFVVVAYKILVVFVVVVVLTIAVATALQQAHWPAWD